MKNKKVLLRKEADRLWFKTYLKSKCEVCGGAGVLQGHHFFYRSSYGHLRYEPNNHITLCLGCHFILHHQDPKKIEMKIIENRGLRWYNALRKKANLRQQTSYQTIKYYEDQLMVLKYAQNS